MDAIDHLADMRLLALPGDRTQRFLNRADLDQRRGLAREQRQFLRRELLAFEAEQRGRRRPARFGIDPHHEQPAPIKLGPGRRDRLGGDMAALFLSRRRDREIRSEEHTSALPSLMRISYAVFCLKKTKNRIRLNTPYNTIIHKQA